MGTKSNPSKYDCYKNAQNDEPMFVLLARDRDAATLVRMWAHRREMTSPGKEGNAQKVTEALAVADAMETWHRANRMPKVEPNELP